MSGEELRRQDDDGVVEEAGIPTVALQAATWIALALLHADSRIGLVRPGYEATL